VNAENEAQAEVLEEQEERAMQRLHGVRHAGDRYIQPLHHHKYTITRKLHTRDKLRKK